MSERQEGHSGVKSSAIIKERASTQSSHSVRDIWTTNKRKWSTDDKEINKTDHEKFLILSLLACRVPGRTVVRMQLWTRIIYVLLLSTESCLLQSRPCSKLASFLNKLVWTLWLESDKSKRSITFVRGFYMTVEPVGRGPIGRVVGT